MARWDIEPNGVRSVLAQTQRVADDFEGHMRAMSTALEGAGAQSSSSIVAEALVGLAEAQRTDIEFVFTRTGASMTAAAEATRAYVEGDLNMAANAQSNAAQAPAPDAPGGGS